MQVLHLFGSQAKRSMVMRPHALDSTITWFKITRKKLLCHKPRTQGSRLPGTLSSAPESVILPGSGGRCGGWGNEGRFHSRILPSWGQRMPGSVEIVKKETCPALVEHVARGEQNLPKQNVSLWHEDSFKPIIFMKQKTQEVFLFASSPTL